MTCMVRLDVVVAAKGLDCLYHYIIYIYTYIYEFQTIHFFQYESVIKIL